MCTSFPALRAAVTLGSLLPERLLFAIFFARSCRLAEAVVNGGVRTVERYCWRAVCGEVLAHSDREAAL